MSASDEEKDEDRKIAKRKCRVEEDFWLFFEGNAWELKHVYWLKKGTSRQRKVKYTQKRLGI